MEPPDWPGAAHMPRGGPRTVRLAAGEEGAARVYAAVLAAGVHRGQDLDDTLAEADKTVRAFIKLLDTEI